MARCFALRSGASSESSVLLLAALSGGSDSGSCLSDSGRRVFSLKGVSDRPLAFDGVAACSRAQVQIGCPI